VTSMQCVDVWLKEERLSMGIGETVNESLGKRVTVEEYRERHVQVSVTGLWASTDRHMTFISRSYLAESWHVQAQLLDE
jgi:hypothetical protein